MKRTILVAALLLLLASCQMTPSHQQAALGVIDDLLRDGKITEEQWRAMREAIVASGAVSWLWTAAQTVGGGILGVLGTRIQRGPSAPPEERMARVARKRRAQTVAATGSGTVSPAASSSS